MVTWSMTWKVSLTQHFSSLAHHDFWYWSVTPVQRLSESSIRLYDFDSSLQPRSLISSYREKCTFRSLKPWSHESCIRPRRTSSSSAVGNPNLSAAVIVRVRVTGLPDDESVITSVNSRVFWLSGIVSATE